MNSNNWIRQYSTELEHMYCASISMDISYINTCNNMQHRPNCADQCKFLQVNTSKHSNNAAICILLVLQLNLHDGGKCSQIQTDKCNKYRYIHTICNAWDALHLMHDMTCIQCIMACQKNKYTVSKYQYTQIQSSTNQYPSICPLYNTFYYMLMHTNIDHYIMHGIHQYILRVNRYWNRYHNYRPIYIKIPTIQYK